MSRKARKAFKTSDSKVTDGFANLTSRLGYGVIDNGLSNGHYQFNMVTRNRIQLEAAYRGNWIVGNIVDAIAEDMTRSKIDIKHADPIETKEIERAFIRKGVWGDITDTIKWSRLYGGAVAVMYIYGQDLATPLSIDTIGKDQFKGLVVYDRWQLMPSMNDIIQPNEGAEAGLPRFYQVVSQIDGRTELGQKIHYTRCIRMDGIKLPYYQAVTEMYWGESVLERLFDRLISFDTATMGAANLVDRAYLRTIGIDGLREILAAGGKAEQGLIQMFDYMRLLQNNEGLTLLDKNDEFSTQSYTFSGLSDVILQFGQQLAGAAQIPLVRLFGQSPAGLSSTGESDMRMYYDNILARQESMLREGIQKILAVIYRSLYAKPIPSDTTFDFRPLWQLNTEQKVNIAKTGTDAIVAAHAEGIINTATALTELKSLSDETGVYSNITDEDIQEAQNEPPMPMVETTPIEPTPKTIADKIKDWIK